jgi:serine phosphatase RsbU (regulator of sigma subunit)
LFSDGYADQFGGDNGKKFMLKRFQDLLISIHHLEMQEQMRELEKALSDWRGPREQVDDVLVVGIRF